MNGIERFVAHRMTINNKSSFSSYILKFAIAALALSIAVMIIATSVIQGFKNEISHKMFDFWGHIVVSDARADQSFELIPIQNATDIIANLKSIHRVEEFKQPSIEGDGYKIVSTEQGVKMVHPFSVMPAIISRKDEFEGLLLKGVEKEFTDKIIQPYLIEGQAINYSPGSASRDMILSEQSCKRMNLSIGQDFIVHFILGESSIKRKFTTAGIYKSGLEEYDQRFAFFDHRWITELMEWNQNEYAGLEIHLENVDNLDVLREYIYLEKLPSNLYAESLKSRSSDIFEWLELQNINEKLILALMAIVGIVNMITAFLIFTLERTRMIGLFKSMGSTDWVIRKIFLLSSGYILIRGIIYGVLLGLAVCLFQKFTGIFKLSEKDYYLSEVPIEINAFTILLLAVGSLVVTAIFLILPSSIISRVSPVSALHFK